MTLQLFYFVIGFVIVLVGFIALIIAVSARLSPAISPQRYNVVETLIIAGILNGILGMFQPWFLPAYRFGFVLLLISTLAFIIWSHVTPRVIDDGTD